MEKLVNFKHGIQSPLGQPINAECLECGYRSHPHHTIENGYPQSCPRCGSPWEVPDPRSNTVQGLREKLAETEKRLIETEARLDALEKANKEKSGEKPEKATKLQK